jgi:hypothetical protein
MPLWAAIAGVALNTALLARAALALNHRGRQ